MGVVAGNLYKRVSLFTLSLILAVSSLSVFGTAIFPAAVGAVPANLISYNSIPDIYPGSFASLGYEATQTAEFGDYIKLASGLAGQVNNVEISLNGWACENDFSFDGTNWTINRTSGQACITTPGSGFNHDITLNIYNVDKSGSVPKTGSLIKSVTKNFKIPYRPSYDAVNCSAFDPLNNKPFGGKWYDSVNHECVNGHAFNINFDLGSLNVVLPSDVIVAIAYNTGDYGVSPLNQNGPYNSLNVSLNENYPPTIGTDVDTDSIFWNTSTAAWYTDKGAAGSGILRNDNVWTPYSLVLKIDMKKLDAPTGLRLNNVNGEFTCGLITNINNITPTWNSVPGATSYNYKVTLPNGVTYGPINVGNVTSVTGAFGGEGLSTFSVQAVNGDAIDSDWATSCAVTYDATAPTVPTLVSPANGSSSTTSNLTKIDWTDSTDITAVSYYYQSSTSSATNPDGSFASPAYTSSALNASEIPTPGTPEGTYYVHVKAVDALGNSSAWSDTWTITVDNAAPATPTLLTTANNGYEKTNNFYFTWTNSSDGGSQVKYEFQSSASNSVDGNGSLVGAWNSIANGNSEQNNLTTPQIHSTGAPDGTYYWQVRAFDAAGNKSAWTLPWKMTIDSVLPGVPIATLLAGGSSVLNGGYTKSKTFTFNLSSSADTNRYQLKYWNDIVGSPFKQASPWNPSDLSGYSSSLGVYNDQFTQGEGKHYFAFSSCDTAGNCSAYSTPFVVTYDKTAPVITVTGGNLTIESGSAYVEQGATWTDNIDGSGDVSDISGTVDATTPGDYTVTYSVTDNAGNTSTATRTVTVKDTTKPVITLNGQSTLSLTVGGTFTDPGAVTDDGSTVVVTGSVNTAVAGSYTLSYDAIDDYGNVATTVKRIVIVSPAPEVLGASTVADNTSNGSTNSSNSQQGSESQDTPETLGAETTNDTNNSQTNTDNTSTDNGWNILGLAWYWWLIIVAAVAGLLWWILAGTRKNQA